MYCTKCNNSTDSVSMNCGCSTTLDMNCINYSGDRLSALNINGGSTGDYALRKINDSVSQMKTDIGSIKLLHPTYYSTILVKDIQSRDALPCHLRKDGTMVTVSDLNYTDFQLQVQGDNTKLCDNSYWVDVTVKSQEIQDIINNVNDLNSSKVDKSSISDSTSSNSSETVASSKALNEVREMMLLDISGEAIPTTTPPATGFYRYIVHTVGTYTNFLEGGVPIEVTTADLDIVNGVANNRVFLEVRDNVATKRVERVKGDAGTFINLIRTESVIPLTLTNAYLNPDGTTTTIGTWRTSDFISVSEDEVFNIIADTSPAATGVEPPRVVGYNNADVATVLLGKGASLSGTDFTIPAGIVKIRTCSYQTPTMVLKKVSMLIDENVLPFKKATTFTETNDTDFLTGKTTADKFFNYGYVQINGPLVNAYISSDGTVVASTNWRTDQEFIDVTEGQQILYKGRTNQSTSGQGVAGYNAAGAFVAIIIGNTDYWDNPILFTVPAGVSKIKSSGFNTTPPILSIYSTTIKPELLPESVATPGKIVLNKSAGFIGTSITYQDGKTYLGTPDGTSGIAKGYQTRIKEVFEFTTYSNYGYSGNSLGGLTAADASSILNKTGWVSHDIFTMESITNDFKRNIPIGLISDYDNATGITTYYGALRAFKDKVLALNASAIIIVANALKRNNSGYTSTSANTAGHTLLDYEKALMTIAKLNDWGYIDQFRESGITDETLTQTTLDGLHPNDFGYRLISKVWIREFWMLSKTLP